jgi:tetratricopeptide (TPR) repeat protein
MRARARTRPSMAEPPAASGQTKAVFPFGRLIVACVAAAAVIIVANAYFAPPGGPNEGPEDRTDRHQQAIALPPPTLFSPEPSIELPSAPVEVPAEELRKELLDMSNELLARFPHVPEALHVTALLYADLQEPVDAQELWKQCIQLQPQEPGPYVGLAAAAMELGQDESAVAILQQAQAAGCQSPEIYHKLGEALTKLGRLDEAAIVGAEGLERFPHAPDNWLQPQLQLDRFAEAESSLKRAVAEGCQSGEVLFGLATACARQGKDEEAAKLRAEFARAKSGQDDGAPLPFQARYDIELRRIAVAALVGAGAVFGHHGDPTRAEQLNLRAFQLDPTSAAIGTELVSLYRGQKRIADARLVQRRLMELEPQVVFHHVNYATLSAHVGDAQAAETEFKQAIAMRPDLAIGYTGLAQLYLQQGNLPQARWFAEAAQRQQPSGPDEAVRTCLVLAAACQQQGDSTAAETALAKARQIAPLDPRLPPMKSAPTVGGGNLQ